MKKIIILTFLFFVANVVFGQEIAYKYKAYLPEKIVNNPEYMKMISQNLAHLAAIHPDLIYYKIKEFKIKFDNTIDNRTYLLTLKKIQNIKTDYINDRNNWAKSQIDKLKSMNLNQSTKEKSIDYFDKIITKKLDQYDKLGTVITRSKLNKKKENINEEIQIDSLEIKNYKMDINPKLIEYFTVLFYESGKEILFDKNIDYYKYKSDIEHRIVEDFFEELKDDYSSIEIENFLSYWYLFQAKNSENHVINAAEFVSRLVSLRNKQALHSGFSLGISYSSFLISPSIKDNIDIIETNRKVDIEEFINLSQIGVFGEYTIKLREELSFVSFLKIQAGFRKFNGSKKVFFDEDYRVNELQADGTRLDSRLQFVINEINIESMQNYILKLNTPLYTIGNNFYLEGGIMFEYLQYNYKLSYDYRYVRNIAYPTVGGGWRTQNITNVRDIKIDLPKDYSNIIIYPLIGFRYRFLKNIYLYAGSYPSNLSF